MTDEQIKRLVIEAPPNGIQFRTMLALREAMERRQREKDRIPLDPTG